MRSPTWSLVLDRLYIQRIYRDTSNPDLEGWTKTLDL